MSWFKEKLIKMNKEYLFADRTYKLKKGAGDYIYILGFCSEETRKYLKLYNYSNIDEIEKQETIKRVKECILNKTIKRTIKRNSKKMKYRFIVGFNCHKNDSPTIETFEPRLGDVKAFLYHYEENH